MVHPTQERDKQLSKKKNENSQQQVDCNTLNGINYEVFRKEGEDNDVDKSFIGIKKNEPLNSSRTPDVDAPTTCEKAEPSESEEDKRSRSRNNQSEFEQKTARAQDKNRRTVHPECRSAPPLRVQELEHTNNVCPSNHHEKVEVANNRTTEESSHDDGPPVSDKAVVRVASIACQTTEGLEVVECPGGDEESKGQNQTTEVDKSTDQPLNDGEAVTCPGGDEESQEQHEMTEADKPLDQHSSDCEALDSTAELEEGVSHQLAPYTERREAIECPASNEESAAQHGASNTDDSSDQLLPNFNSEREKAPSQHVPQIVSHTDEPVTVESSECPVSDEESEEHQQEIEIGNPSDQPSSDEEPVAIESPVISGEQLEEQCEAIKLESSSDQLCTDCGTSDANSEHEKDLSSQNVSQATPRSQDSKAIKELEETVAQHKATGIDESSNQLFNEHKADSVEHVCQMAPHAEQTIEFPRSDEELDQQHETTEMDESSDQLSLDCGNGELEEDPSQQAPHISHAEEPDNIECPASDAESEEQHKTTYIDGSSDQHLTDGGASDFNCKHEEDPTQKVAPHTEEQNVIEHPVSDEEASEKQPEGSEIDTKRDQLPYETCDVPDVNSEHKEDRPQHVPQGTPFSPPILVHTQSSTAPEKKRERKCRQREKNPLTVKRERQHHLKPQPHTVKQEREPKLLHQKRSRKRPKKCGGASSKGSPKKQGKEERCGGGGQSQPKHEQKYVFQQGTQRLSSGGGSGDDNNDEGGGDKRRYFNVSTCVSNQNWILLFLMILLVLCFLVHPSDDPYRVSHNLSCSDPTCSQLVLSSVQLKIPDIQKPSQETGTPGDERATTCRGGFLSRPSTPPASDNDVSGSSSTFPRGRSLSRLISEEESHDIRDHDHEMACLKKAFRRKKRQRERDEVVELDNSPDPAVEWDYDTSQDDTSLSSNSALKAFTSFAPDTVGGAHTPNVGLQGLQEGTACSGNSMICTTRRTFSVPEDHSSRSLPFLTEATVCRVPLNNSMNHVVPDREEEADEEKEDSPNVFQDPCTPHQCSRSNDTEDIFRGPGTLPRSSPKAKQERTPTIDSGVGTISGAAANPVPSSPPVVGVEVDISWRSSTGDKEQPVYQVPGSGGDHQSSFQGDTVPVTEQTPRSTANREELVCVKLGCKVQQRLDLPNEQPEPHESFDDSLQSALQVFSYPLPEPYYPLVDCSVPRDLPLPLCVFVGGSSTSYVRRMCEPVAETRRYLTEAKIDRYRRCSLKTFTTHL